MSIQSFYIYYASQKTTIMKQKPATTKKIATTLLVVIILFATSCKKEKTTNPDDYVVRVGNQAFGAYLNGQPWVADYRDAGNGIEPITVSMRDPYLPGLIPHYTYMWLYGLKSNEEISIYISPPLVPGRKLLNVTTFPYPQELQPPSYGMYYVYLPERKYMTTTAVTGFIDIMSVDTLRRTIEGRFEFEAINSATNEKIKITNGYFKKNAPK
jgi:hypothetical protein